MARKVAWLCFLVVISLFLSTLFVQCELEGDDSEEEKESAEETADVGKEDEIEVKEEDDVLVLTDKNFDGVIEKNKVVLVEFYAPWCGHCKQLAPEYAKAAAKLKSGERPVPLGKVDCTVEVGLASRFSVQGYPTLKIFRDGEEEDYDGPRQEDGIVKYMLEKSDPNYKPPPDEVITLTKDNFHEVVNREEMILVEFYAPWCGHCKKLAPELEKAAKTLKARPEAILIGKVDATIETELAKEFGVSGYPTMKIFRKGKATEYKGPREADGIIDYMISHSGISSTLYKTFKEVKEFMKSNLDEPVILGVFEDEKDPMYQLFLDANDEIRDDYRFGHTFSKDVKKMFGMKKESAIVVVHPEYLISNYEKRYQFYLESSGNVSSVQDFYKEYHVPLVGHMQKNTEKRFTKRPLVIVFYDVNFQPAYRSMTQFWREKVLRVAREYPDMLFAVADEEAFEDKVTELGLSESGEDVNVGLYDEYNRKFAMVDEELNEDSLTEFIEQYKKGQLKPIIKSQPPAPKAKPGKVQAVVGSTFDDIVMDESKEVLIEFYAPWCGHCKAIEPDIIELAKYYKKQKNVVIAKMDATANDFPPQYKVEGFPTIYFAKPGHKNDPIMLGGKRDLEAMKLFVKRNSDTIKKKKDEL